MEMPIYTSKSRKMVVENFERWRYALETEKGIQDNQERDSNLTDVSMKGERVVGGGWFWKEMRWKRWMATHTLSLQC